MTWETSAIQSNRRTPSTPSWGATIRRARRCRRPGRGRPPPVAARRPSRPWRHHCRGVRGQEARASRSAVAGVDDLLLPRLAAAAIILLVGFPIHEFSHAFAADRLGDRTARWLGRLSLDPRRHFDPLGGGVPLGPPRAAA